MADLVTLSEAKDYCRITDTDFDDMLAIVIAAASDAVRDMADGWDDTGEVPARLKLAVLARVVASFDNPEQVPLASGEERLVLPYRTLDP